MASWEVTLVLMVRNLIGDTETDVDEQTFSDARIQQAVVTAGIISTQDYEFSTDYLFDLESIDISPDPVEANDKLAMALFTLKAACILNLNSYTSAVGGGIRVKDGSSAIDTTGNFGGYKDIILLGPCGAYTKLLESALSTNINSLGGAVSGPFTSYVNGYPTWNDCNTRSFFDGFAY